jgi:pimeloyl-ACP methyl ester carboxylesterase
MILDDDYQIAMVNGIEIVFDTFGDPSSIPVLLIMGLGAQMIDWREEFCTMLAGHGYWVIRFDNRDAGKSYKFEDAEMPDLFELLTKVSQGESVSVTYTIDDMAADAIGLLDQLNIENAHVVGLSMGGMIAQTVALNQSNRVLSLTSIMSSARYMYPPSAEAAALLNRRAPDSREEYIEYALENSKILGGTQYVHDESLYRQHAGRKFDRGLYPPGFARQLAAVMVQEDRRSALCQLMLPTLVIHGDADPLVPVEGGIETAEACPDSRLKIIEGWGHGFPPVIWPTIIEALVSHFSAGQV